MKSKLIIALKIAVLTLIFFWIVIVFADYFRVRQNKNPMFCIKEVINEYNDGSTYICTGLGYKMIRYNRKCLSAKEFGPFLIKERFCSGDN